MPTDARKSAVAAQLNMIHGVSLDDAFDLSTQKYSYLTERKAVAWGADVTLGGFVALSSPQDDSAPAAAMVWGKSDSKTQINLAALCAAPLRRAQVDVGVLSGFGLSESMVVLGSDGLLRVPGKVLPPSDELNAKLRNWTLAGEARVEAPELPDDPDLWTGVYFSGLLSPMVSQTSVGQMDVFFKWLRMASLRVKGLLVADREDSVAVSLSWTPRADEHVILTLGSNPNWSVSLTGATLKGRIGGSESSLDLLTVQGTITIDNYATKVSVTFQFDEKTIDLVAQPEWGVSLAWLKSLGGEQSFTDGGGDILVRHAPSSGAAPALKIKSLEISLGYGGGFAVRRLALTVKTDNEWEILHGKLNAEVGVSLLFAPNVTFNASLDGEFVWRELALSARLDTSCGAFMARYEKETKGAQAFLTRHLSPDPAAATVAPTAQTRLNVENLSLAVAEVYGNYKESSFGVALETTGAIDFTINGNVKLVISDLQASGELSAADGAREWSLTLSASVNLVEENGGTRTPLLGRGAVLTGAVGSHELKFGLFIDKIQFAKIIPSLFNCPCPELLKDASLDGLALSYDRARGFSFQTSGELPLGDTLSLTALKFAIASSGAIVFAASADFRWKGAADKMTAALTGRDGVWSLTAHAPNVNVGRLINAVGYSDVKGDVSATDVSLTMAFGGDGVALSLSFNTAFGSNAVKMGLYAARKSSGTTVWRVLFFGNLTLDGKALPLGGNLLSANQISINLALTYLKGEKKAIAEAFGASSETNAARKVLDSLPDSIPERVSFAADIKGAAVAAANANAPQGPGGGAARAEPAPAEPAAADADGLTWSTLNKRFGPLSIDRIGYGALKQKAGGASEQTGRLSVDGGLNLGPLKFTLLGLGVDATFPSFTIKPRLEGLGLNVKRGPVSISGSLLIKDGVYAGSAQVTTAKFSLGAVGRLDLTRGRPSFFLYCVAAASLGGPPAFFVRGLAGGMGYDTRLILPDVKKVKDFPLLTAIQTGDLDTRAFDAVVQPATDSLWFAAGVRFSTFAMMESSVVVTLSLGAKTEIDLFGLSEITVPPLPPGAPGVIAKITIAIRGKLDAEKSEAWIRGQIVPGSFVFDPGCRLSGEFGFKVWFGGGRKGDFYATVGGFHPKFLPPPHYDKFERLRLEWRPTNELSIRGSAYLAITSRAIMAGGDLDVLYRDGRVSASFLAGAHFLASWEPFHYSAEVYVSVDAQWRTFWDDTWTYHVGAMVRMEGPPLHGVAYVELPVVTLKVEFGSNALAKPPPLDWSNFRKRLLPETILSIRATGFTPPPNSAGMRKIAVALRPGQSCLIEIETAVPVMELETPQPLGGLKLKKPLKKDDVAIPAMSGKLTQSKLSVTTVAASDWGGLGSAIRIDVKQTDAGSSPSVWRIGPEPPGGGRSDAELLKQGVGPEVCNGLTIALSFPENGLTQPVGKAVESAKERLLAFIAPAPATWSKSKAGPWPAKPINAGGEGREAKP